MRKRRELMTYINLVGIINCRFPLRDTRGKEPLAFTLTIPRSCPVVSLNIQLADFCYGLQLYKTLSSCVLDGPVNMKHFFMFFYDYTCYLGRAGVGGSQN